MGGLATVFEGLNYSVNGLLEHKVIAHRPEDLLDAAPQRRAVNG